MLLKQKLLKKSAQAAADPATETCVSNFPTDGWMSDSSLLPWVTMETCLLNARKTVSNNEADLTKKLFEMKQLRAQQCVLHPETLASPWLCSQLRPKFFYFSQVRFFLFQYCVNWQTTELPTLFSNVFFVHQGLYAKALQAWRQKLTGPHLGSISVNTCFSCLALQEIDKPEIKSPLFWSVHHKQRHQLHETEVLRHVGSQSTTLPCHHQFEGSNENSPSSCTWAHKSGCLGILLKL